MKRWKIFSIVLILVLTLTCSVVFTACGKKQTNNYNEETETAIKDFVSQYTASILESEMAETLPEWAINGIESAGDRLIKALKNSGITQQEVTDILALIQDAISESQSISSEEGMTAFIEGLFQSINGLTVTPDKFAAFLYEAVSSVKDIVEEAAADDDFKDMILPYKEYYDNVLNFGRDKFVTAFSAVIELSLIESELNLMDIPEDAFEFATEAEFLAFINGIKGDLLSTMDIMSSDAINALADFAKIFTPLLAEIDGDITSEEINESIDAVKGSYAKNSISTKAMLNAIDDNMLKAIYNEIFVEDTPNMDVIAIAAAKLFDAGFKASGGFTEDEIVELLAVVGLPEEVMEMVAESIEIIKEAANILAAKGYDADLSSYDADSSVGMLLSMIEGIFSGATK